MCACATECRQWLRMSGPPDVYTQLTASAAAADTTPDQAEEGTLDTGPGHQSGDTSDMGADDQGGMWGVSEEKWAEQMRRVRAENELIDWMMMWIAGMGCDVEGDTNFTKYNN